MRKILVKYYLRIDGKARHRRVTKTYAAGGKRSQILSGNDCGDGSDGNEAELHVEFGYGLV
jgi:hypothetical protein